MRCFPLPKKPTRTPRINDGEKRYTLSQTLHVAVGRENALLRMASSVKENIAHFAEENNIEVTLSGTPANIHCNGSMVYGAIYNLVDNAIKYSPKGSAVHITTESDNEKAYIKVEDNGIGIPEEYQDRVFERFFRVDKSRSKEVGGSGLGLAIVKHSCMSNGGEVSVESEVGRGSVFTITFPIANDADAT